MFVQAGELGIVVDTGISQHGKLQRLEDDEWVDFKRDGKVLHWPVPLRELPPGQYRVRD